MEFNKLHFFSFVIGTEQRYIYKSSLLEFQENAVA